MTENVFKNCTTHTHTLWLNSGLVQTSWKSFLKVYIEKQKHQKFVSFHQNVIEDVNRFSKKNLI